MKFVKFAGIAIVTLLLVSITGIVEARQAVWEALNAAGDTRYDNANAIPPAVITSLESAFTGMTNGQTRSVTIEELTFNLAITESGRRTINGNIVGDGSELLDGTTVRSYERHEAEIDTPIRNAMESGRSQVLGAGDDTVDQAVSYLRGRGDTEAEALERLQNVITNGRVIFLNPAENETFAFRGHASGYEGGSIYLTVQDAGTLIHEVKALQGYTHNDAARAQEAFYNTAGNRDSLLAELAQVDVHSASYLAANLDVFVTDPNVDAVTLYVDEVLKRGPGSEEFSILKGRAEKAKAAGKIVIAVTRDRDQTRDILAKENSLQYFDAVVTTDELREEFVIRGIDPSKTFAIVAEWQRNQLRDKYDGFNFAVAVVMPDDSAWDTRELALRSIRDLAEEK